MRVLAGQQDEAFFAERYAGLFQAEGKDVPVTLLPGVGHVGLALAAAGRAGRGGSSA